MIVKVVNLVKLGDGKGMECVENKFLKLPNIQKYEVDRRTKDGFIASVEMDDGFVFKKYAYSLQQVFPSAVMQLIEKKSDGIGSRILISPYISDKTAQICEKHGMGQGLWQERYSFISYSLDHISVLEGKLRKLKQDTGIESYLTGFSGNKVHVYMAPDHHGGYGGVTVEGLPGQPAAKRTGGGTGRSCHAKGDYQMIKDEDMKSSIDYSEEQKDAAHRILVELVNIFKEYEDDIRIVGGWVPDLMFPGEGHTGSVVAVVPYLIMKAAAMGRGKVKDAYDIYFLLKHYRGGVKEPAKEFQPAGNRKLVQEMKEKLSVKFASADHAGPKDVADFLGLEDDEDVELVRRDAYEQIQALLKMVS